jgi:hypothetical protein
MQRYLPVILLACVMLSSPFGGAIAQSKPTVVVKDITQRNPLIDDVARNDPDGLRSLLQRLEILTTGQRDSGPARSGSTSTAQESAQIAANPLLSEAYTKDRAATLALLRATNEELDRARRREPMEQRRRVALVIGNSGDRTWGLLDTAGNDASGAPARTAAYVPNITVDEGPFHCPTPGTTVTLDVPAGAVRGTYETTDPADPVLCRIVTSDGESKSLLYNFYDAGSLLGQASIRKGMDDLLSKHADQVTFEMYYSFYNRTHETWKRIGIEALPIDGRYVRTVKFERTSTTLSGPLPGISYAMGTPTTVNWLIWYDPVADVFVKSERQTPNASAGLGAGMSGAFKVISVTHD